MELIETNRGSRLSWVTLPPSLDELRRTSRLTPPDENFTIAGCPRLTRLIAGSCSAVQVSIVALNRQNVRAPIHMPWCWPFPSHACRAAPRCCLWAVWSAERHLPAA